MKYHHCRSVLLTGMLSSLVTSAHPADAFLQLSPHSISSSSSNSGLAVKETLRGGRNVSTKKGASPFPKDSPQRRIDAHVIMKASALSPEVPKQLTKNTIVKLPVLQGLTFLFILSTALTALAPPPALVTALGTEKATQLLSIVSGTGALIEIMFSTVFGAALDVRGRKPAMIVTALAMAVANGAVAVQSSVSALCISKFVGMISVGFFTMASQAMISDMSMAAAANDKNADTDKLVGSAMGTNMALTGLGFLGGIIGAGLLSESGGLPVIYGTSTAVAFLTAAVLSFFMPETLTAQSKPVAKGGSSGSLWKKVIQAPLASARLLYRHGSEVRTLAILLMLMSIPANQGDLLQIFAKTEWGLSTKSFSSYLALFGLVGIFANGFGSVLVKKLGIKKFTILAILSRTVTAVGTAFFGYKGSVIGLLVGFLGAAQSIGIVAALISAGAKSGLPQGELAGERSSLLALLKVVGPLFYSFLYVQGTGKLGLNNLPFIFNIALCGMALVVAQASLKGGEMKEAKD